MAAWAETEIVLAADLGDGTDDPRATAPGLLRRALASLPERARLRPVAMRADAGYFAGQLARAAHDEHIAFAIGAKRIAPLWRLLAGIAEDAWHDAIDMDGAQIAVAEYCPDWWPADTRLLIRRVLLDPAQVSADPRSRRRRTLHPDQRALPIPELARAGAIYAYSFILTNLDVSSPDKAVAAEHWYQHRTTVENIFRDSKLGAALRHHQGTWLALIPQAVGVPDAIGAVQRAALNVVQAEAALAVLDNFAGALGQTRKLGWRQQWDSGAHVSALPTILIGEFGRPIGSVGEQRPPD